MIDFNFCPPRDACPEEKIQQPEVASVVSRIMAEVLGVPRVTGADSFYDFGGSSLKAMLVCARVKKQLGVGVSPEKLFDSDTIGDFAAAVADARQALN